MPKNMQVDLALRMRTPYTLGLRGIIPLSSRLWESGNHAVCDFHSFIASHLQAAASNCCSLQACSNSTGL